MKNLLYFLPIIVLIRISSVTAANCDAWEPDTHYTIGQKVTYNGQGYECTVYDVWYWPPTDTRYWVTTNECDAPPEKCDLQIQLDDYGANEVNATPEGYVETYYNGEITNILFKYDCGTNVTLTALPFEGYEFKHWIINGNPETTNPWTITVNDKENAIVAEPIFEEIPVPQYSLTINTGGSGNGTVTVEPLKALYDEGEKVTLIAGPNSECDEFVRWLGEPVDSNMSTIAYITINSNITLTAEFIENRTCAPAAEYLLPSEVDADDKKMRVGDLSLYENAVKVRYPVSAPSAYDYTILSNNMLTFYRQGLLTLGTYTQLGQSFLNLFDNNENTYTKMAPASIIARQSSGGVESITEISGGDINCNNLTCSGFITGKFYNRSTISGSGQWSAARIENGRFLTSSATAHEVEIVGSTIKINKGITQIGPGYINVKRINANEEVKTRKVIVTDQGWSDHVFQKDYQLPSLSAIEKFISENGHLPGIPSEKEVKKDGVNVGEMQSKLLEKIEEMTIHMIKMQKRIEFLESELESK